VKNCWHKCGIRFFKGIIQPRPWIKVFSIIALDQEAAQQEMPNVVSKCLSNWKSRDEKALYTNYLLLLLLNCTEVHLYFIPL